MGVSVREYRLRKLAEKNGVSYEEQVDTIMTDVTKRLRHQAALEGTTATQIARANAQRLGGGVYKDVLETAAEIAQRDGTSVETVLDGGSEISKEPPVAALGQLAVYRNPPVIVLPTQDGGDMERHAITAATNASVDSAGGIAATRGRNLAAKGAATLVIGPLGTLMFGNAKEKIHDGRELYLLANDPEWSFVIPVHPDLGGDIRMFALAINQVAAAQKAPSASSETSADSTIESLERLVSLRDSGALTDEEFETQKRRLLDN